MKNIITILCICTFKLGFSQIPNIDSLYNVKTSTHIYKIIKKDTLKLDIYLPKNPNKNKPLIIYLHGGGFATGSRNAPHIVKFCHSLAQRGFVVAPMSYRLSMKNIGLGCDVRAKDKIKAFNKASEDISYAVEFLLKNKRKFSINTDKIILSGTSSGAEAILNVTYNFKNKILPKKFKFAGVISMSGALTSLENITGSTAIPTQLFHGTSDNLVPYHVSAHHFCKENEPGYLLLYGSRIIADRLKGLGKSYYLVSSIGAPHHWSSSPMDNNFNDILDFLYFDVLKEGMRQTERTIGF